MSDERDPAARDDGWLPGDEHRRRLWIAVDVKEAAVCAVVVRLAVSVAVVEDGLDVNVDVGVAVGVGNHDLIASGGILALPNGV